MSMDVTSPNTHPIRCDLCGADHCKVLFFGQDRRHDTPGTFRVVECLECGLIYINPQPAADELSRYYPDEYAPYTVGEGLFGKLTGALRAAEVKRIVACLSPGARVLEVGCASGDLLVHLRDAGLDVMGVEMSPFAAQAARGLGLTVHTGTLTTAPLQPAEFDAVVMRAVIPHLPSPNTELGLVASYIKPGGLFFATVENAASLERAIFKSDWYGYDVPRHLNLFTPITLRRLLKDHQLKIEKSSFSLVPNYWVGSLKFLLKRRIGNGVLTRFVSIKNPILLGMFLPITLMQKMLGLSSRLSVVARKQA